MWNNGKELKQQLINLEKLREGIMLQINRLNDNKETVAPTKVYPMSKIKLHEINDYPVVQFNYEGLLPIYIEDSEYERLIKNYYFHATISAYDYEGLENVLSDEVVIIYCQYFRNDVVRDLDNRNFKYIQDAIRSTCLIADDNWNSVWNMNMGLSDEEHNHVQVYIVDRKNYIDFYNWIEKNHYQLTDKVNYPFSKEEFIVKFQNKIEKNKENKLLKYKNYMDDNGDILKWFDS